MNDLSSFVRIIVYAGIFVSLTGIVLAYASKFSYLGKLSGDILLQNDSFIFYSPLATTLMISVLLTVLVNLLIRR